MISLQRVGFHFCAGGSGGKVVGRVEGRAHGLLPPAETAPYGKDPTPVSFSKSTTHSLEFYRCVLIL